MILSRSRRVIRRAVGPVNPCERLEQRVMLSTTYTVTDLGILQGASLSQANAINDSGEVAGYSDAGGQQAFTWTSSAGLTPLGDLPGGTFSDAAGINNSGDVVGAADSRSGPETAFLFTPGGGMQDLGSLPGIQDSRANGINTAGDVVGDSPNMAGHAFLWTAADGMQDLGTLPGGGTGSGAYAINDSNEVVGYSDVSPSSLTRHAFLWTAANGMQDLGTLQGATSSIATAINAAGEVVGESDAADAQDAFLWTAAGGMQDLGVVPGGNIATATGINDTGDIVGFSNQTSSESNVAFVWDATDGIQDLNTLIPSNSGWTLLEATAVNDAGQIVGFGTNPQGRQDAFLLTPQQSTSNTGTDPNFGAATGGSVIIPFVTEQVVQESSGQILTIGHEGSTGNNTSQGLIERLNSDGSTDDAFGPDGDGLASTDPSDNDAFFGAVIQPDGKIVAVGTSNGSFLVARYNADGTQDTAFGTNGFATASWGSGVTAVASTVALEPSGAIVVGGVEGTTFAVARFTASGRLDASFNPGGVDDASFPAGGQVKIPNGAAGAITQIVVQGDGKILGVGSSGTSVIAFRLNTDGSADTSFGSGEIASIPTLTSADPASSVAVTPGIGLQPGGDILVSGEAPNPGGLAAVRLNSSGQPDITFGDSGVAAATFGGTHDDCNGVVVNPADGEFLLVGTTDAGGTTQIAIAAFNPDGSVNTGFGTNGQLTLADSSLESGSVTAAPGTGGKIRPAAFHPLLSNYAFAGFQGDGKVLVGASGQANAALKRTTTVSPSQSTIGSFGKMGKKNVKLPAFTLANGTSVTITLSGGTGTATHVGNEVALDLTGSVTVNIKTRGGTQTMGLSNVTASGNLKSLTAPTATLDGTLSAPAIGQVRFSGISGVMISAAGINSVTTTTMSGSISAAGAIKTAKLGAVTGTVAAAQIRSFSAVSITGATILAGANLGSDGQLGGTGSAADTFTTGQILTMSVKGTIAASFIGAGANPVDGIFGDGDDSLAGAGSLIKSLTSRQGLDATTKFESGSFPTFVHLPAKTSTANNSQFIVL